MFEKSTVMDAEGINRSIARIATEILERNGGIDNLVIIGIRAGGVYLAHRLREAIKRMEGAEVPVGILDITLYRDDIGLSGTGKPRLGTTRIPFSLDKMVVVLFDDVIFTGRTTRAAMDALIDFGRPKRIELAVLIDRGHRELPICPNYVGKSLPSALWERVTVYLNEEDGKDEVVIEKA
ncbi:MAG: bifunctional pyr operon transcriptional regulator/uracil phosphoribosyltransferase PyrR [Deltaproteobacteria bacterium]|nr:bifunctional pyr operon transcriptional regulator/uracil phosphoribosyltransferase PyrR [Deltaproteobacteria bacterium]